MRLSSGRPTFEFSDRGGSAAQYVLGAVYAARQLPYGPRQEVLSTVRRAFAWPGGSDGELLRFLDGHREAPVPVPEDRTWALGILELETLDGLVAADVQKRFRRLVATAHPDTGGADGEAGATDQRPRGGAADPAVVSAAVRAAGGLLLAPGAGGDPDHHTLVALERALAPLPVRRLEFPHRSGGRRGPPPRAERLVPFIAEQAAAMCAEESIDPASLVLGGRSMGGRVCSLAVADGLPAAGLVPPELPAAPAATDPTTCGWLTSAAWWFPACS